MCMYVCLRTWGHIPKIQIERKRRYIYISNFHMCWSFLIFCATKLMASRRVTQCWGIYWIRQTDCVWEREERATARLQWTEQTEVRQARLNRRSIHSEESVMFIGVKLVRGPSCDCQLALNIKFWRCYITHQWQYSCISSLRLTPTMFYIF